MKVVIKKDVLTKTLSNVEKAVNKNHTVPVLKGVYFEATEKFVEFIGADDEQVISVKLPVDNEEIIVSESGKLVFSLDANNIIKKLNDSFVHIESEGTNYEIKSALSNFKLSGYNPEDYPTFEKVDSNDKIIEFNAEELKAAVGKLDFAAAKSETRPILQGIHLTSDSEKNELKFVSTNSHILSQKVVSKDVKGDFKLTPKAKTLSDAIKVFESKDTIQVFANQNYLILKSDSITVRNRLLEGNFPDTDRLLVTQFRAVIEIEKQHFLSALEQVLILCQSNGLSAATIEVNDDNIILKNSTTDTGIAEIKVPVKELQKDVEDLNIKFAFNVNYMIDLAKAVDGNVKLGYVDTLRPISVLGTESNGEYKLILPVRV